MLTYQQLYREVEFRKSVTKGIIDPPKRVGVYVKEENYRFKQIPASDFQLYSFVEYTYEGSLFPVVTHATK